MAEPHVVPTMLSEEDQALFCLIHREGYAELQGKWAFRVGWLEGMIMRLDRELCEARGGHK